ncbi:hypothetical protein QFZ81_004067 [Paenibacillus sp. V4I9]|uniref:hypothetical protein n=1 Tax=Paenibacillus sp. V4I9 TaxID=3042308 RepID=UPI002787F7A4|nr:hypothetical protein [Paenibacillus sp. V4I9]MDQ0888979.1 hypothetical protein [Paenibacillus sp. V4I9]
MKRFLILLVIALMTLTVIACSSSEGNPEASVSPKVTASATTSITPAPSDSSMASTAPTPTPTPTATSVVSVTPSPTESSKPSVTPASTDSSKASATTVPADSPKASVTSTPAATQPETKPEPTQQPEISPKGKKVLFVGREQVPVPAEDVVMADRLKGMGFIVTRLGDKDFTADETKGYDLLYFSQTVNSKFLKGGVMKDVAIPTVYVKSHGMFYLGLSSLEEGATVKKIKSIDIVDSKHKVAGGLSGTVDVYKEADTGYGVSYGIVGKEAKVIATIPGDKTKAALYYYDKGSKADNGYTVKARVSFYYWSNGMQDNSTDAGWKLWDNIVLWTLQNG